MADGTVKIDTSLDNSGFENGLKGLGKLAKTGAKAAVSAVLGVSAALGGMGVAAVSVGSNFEEGMSKVAAISGATGSDLEALTEKAKEMGAKTKFSATESASAMEYMAMAGWKTTDMLDGIEGIMNLAAASGEDLATTSDIVTDALTAFGLSAKDSTHFADIMAAASSNANTNVSLMGETFKYVAPVAGALGFKAEDAAVAIGLMANSGIKGGQAGTALRSMLTRLAKPTDDVQAAMDALGVSLTDSEGNMKSLDDIMGDLKSGFNNLSEAEKAQYAATIAGQEGMSGLLAIVGTSDDDFNKLKDAVYGCDGASQQMAETMQDNLKGSVTILKSSLEGLGIEIYESMAEPLKGAADAATSYVNDLTEAFKSGGLEGLVDKAGDIFAELVTKAAEQAPKMIDTAVSLIESFVKGLAKNKKRLLEGAKSIVKALADGLVKLLPNGMKRPVQEAINAISKSFESGGLKKAVETVVTIFDNLCKVATNLAKAVIPPLVKMIDALAENLDILLPAITGVYMAMKSFSIITSITSGVGTLKTAVKGLFDLLSGNPIAAVISAVGGLMGGIAALSLTIPDANAEIKASADEMANLAYETEQAKTAREEAAAGIDTEYGNYQKLWEELQRNVDQNGKVREGYEKRAAFITNELSNATGIEIELNNGVIQSYQDIQREIGKTIEKKRAEALLNAYRSDYEEAIKNEADAQKNYTDALAEQKPIAEENAKLHAEYKTLSEEASAATNLSETASREYEQQLSDLTAQIVKSDEALTAADKKVESNTYTWQQNQQVIGNYESAAGAVEAGSYDMNVALLAMEKGLLHHGDVSADALAKQRQDAYDHYQELKGLVGVEGSGVTQEMVDEAGAMFALTHSEWLQGTGGTEKDINYWNAVASAAIDGSGFPEVADKEAREAMGNFSDEIKNSEPVVSRSTRNTINAAHDSMMDVSFTGIGKKKMDQVVDGVGLKDGNVSSAATGVLENARDEASSVDFTPAGNNAGAGMEAGINSWVDRVSNAARNLMRQAMDAANKEQDAHSPSKKMIKSGEYFGMGAEVGIEKKTPDVAEAGGDMMKAAIDAANRKAALMKMRAAMDISVSRAAMGMSLGHQIINQAGNTTEYGDVNQTVNINQPVRSPVETARELRKVGKELAFG